MTATEANSTIARVFTRQQARQWGVKATSADAIIAAALEDTCKPDREIRTIEVTGIMGSIQRNTDNLDASITPADVASAERLNGGQAGISPGCGFVREGHQDALVEGFKAFPHERAVWCHQ